MESSQRTKSINETFQVSVKNEVLLKEIEILKKWKELSITRERVREKKSFLFKKKSLYLQNYNKTYMQNLLPLPIPLKWLLYIEKTKFESKDVMLKYIRSFATIIEIINELLKTRVWVHDNYLVLKKKSNNKKQKA